MANRLPKISTEHKICIICEGNEEYAYLERLKELKVWDSQYDVHLVNATGNGNIPARYQDRYQNGAYELVFVFCDTERNLMNSITRLRKRLMSFMVLNMQQMQ